jgi:hypothetical protein
LRKALLVAVVVLAALLRFVGLGHHLRHGGPEFDERHNFVDPVLRMWDSGSPDPTVYNGYPGFFNYLAFLPVGLARRLGGERGAYLAARGLAASAGTLSVLLAYLLGRRWHGGEWTALAGAALLAVSRLEVRSAHYVTADVLVGTATLGALLALVRWPERKGELWAAAVAALGTAVKYTGLVLAPALFVHFWLEGRLKRGLLPAALVAAAVFVVAAPYALLGLGTTGAGLASGLDGYFGSQHGHVGGSGLPELIGTLWLSVGPIGLILAALSPALPERRRLAPAWTVVLAMVAVSAAANLVFARHLTSAAVTLPVLAGAGLEWVRRRGAPLAVAAAVAAVLPPAYLSAQLLERYLRPMAVEQAAIWIESHVQSPALVASTVRLQLPPSRFEVRTLDAPAEVPADALLQYDAIVSAAGELAALRPAAAFTSEEGPAFVFVPPPAAWRPVPPPQLRATSDAIELRWPQPVRVARVEVEADEWPQPLRLVDGSGEPVAAEGLRPTRPARQREGAPHGQSYALVPPRDLTVLRVERTDGRSLVLSALRVLTR